jgi:hypothetical protein
MGGVAVVKRCMPGAPSREGCTLLDAVGVMEKCVGDMKGEDFGMRWGRRLDKSSVDGEGRM